MEPSEYLFGLQVWLLTLLAFPLYAWALVVAARKAKWGWFVVGLLVAPMTGLYYSGDGDRKIKKLRRDVRELRNEVRELKSNSVRLTPGSNSYQVIRHSLGAATLNLTEVKAHEGGSSALTLEIGNLTSVHMAGAALEIGSQHPSNPAIERTSHYTFQQTLEAGKATKVVLILGGAPPSMVTYIRVSNFQPAGIRIGQAK